jgi:hypothetical protein
MMRYLPLFILFIFSCGTENAEEVDTDESKEIAEEDTSPYGDHSIVWNYESEFKEEEKSRLKEWIIEVVDATTATIGEYPFDLHIYFQRSDRGGQPVGFGHTIRGPEQSVRFYVDPSFSKEEFMEDWVAPHEISHLSQPFVGKNNKWFSEGYATYMSRQIMMEMGYYTEEEFDSIYFNRISQTKYAYGSNLLTHIQVSDSLLEHYIYGDMYWGSASYFFTVDQQLKEKHNIRFRDVVKDYQNCCRLKDKSLLSIVQSYDSIIEDTLFTSLMRRYRNQPAGSVMENY